MWSTRSRRTSSCLFHSSMRTWSVPTIVTACLKPNSGGKCPHKVNQTFKTTWRKIKAKTTSLAPRVQTAETTLRWQMRAKRRSKPKKRVATKSSTSGRSSTETKASASTKACSVCANSTWHSNNGLKTKLSRSGSIYAFWLTEPLAKLPQERVSLETSSWDTLTTSATQSWPSRWTLISWRWWRPSTTRTVRRAVVFSVNTPEQALYHNIQGKLPTISNHSKKKLIELNWAKQTKYEPKPGRRLRPQKLQTNHYSSNYNSS